MCWDCYGNKGGDPYKDFRHGKVEVSDFDDEFRYVKPGRKTQFEWSGAAVRRARIKKVKKTRAGCPQNDMKAHLYVWTTEAENEKTIFFRFFGFHKYHREVCCGCGKVRNTELSPRYLKRKDRAWEKMNEPFPKGEPVPRTWRWRGVKYSYFTWENYNEEYMAFKRAEVERHGSLNVDLDGRFLGIY